MSNFRGWQVEYKDGSIIKEPDVEWKQIKKNQINKLTLFFDGRKWELEGKDGYLQKKRASMVPGIQESLQVEARSIGYYEGSSKVWYTVDEFTGVMKITIEG